MQGLNPEVKSLKDWQQLLAEPEKHWRKGYSAYELAYSWMNSSGFPASVDNVLSNSGFSEFKDLKIDIAYPERKTNLNDSGRPSQTDLMVLANGANSKVVIGVEGKVDESFGPIVHERYSNEEANRSRLNFLCSQLGLSSDKVEQVRYQLIHRSVATILEAKNYNAKIALMLVHSFSEKDSSVSDYQHFLGLFNFYNVQINKIYGPILLKDVSLFIGWVKDHKSS